MSYQVGSKQPYVSQFLSLKCAGDVLNIINPLGNHAEKEISESMGIIKYLRDITLKSPMKHTLYDLCAGNALTSVIAAHLLPIKNAVAIDKRCRNRDWQKARNFSYQFEDIFNLDPAMFEEDSIIIGIHACEKLAKQIIKLYRESKAKYLILMPCCEGSLSGKYQLVCDRLGKAFTWCLELAIMADGRMIQDNRILSPKNIVIIAEKKER
jgi:hypothetical protein